MIKCDLFFQLIQVAIGCREALSEKPSDEHWQTMFDLAVKHSLVGVCGIAIERLADAQRPPRNIAMQWAFLVDKIERRNRWLNAKCAELTELFVSDGFSSFILKGQGLATLYPFPLRRQSGDIDIMVVPNGIAETSCGMDEVVEYVRSHSDSAEAVYHHVELHAAFKRMPDGKVEYVNAEADKGCMGIEVHYRPSWFYSPLRNHRFQKWALRHRTDIRKSSDGTFFMPSPEYNAIYILVHIYRHLFDEGIGLRQLLDYYYVLVDMDRNQVSLDGIRQHLTSFGLVRFCRAVMYVLHHVFGLDERQMILPMDEKEGRFLLTEIMLAGNFGRYDERSNPKQDESLWVRFVRRQRRVARFLLHYPEETVCAPFWTIGHWIWRWRKGYLPDSSHV